MTWRYYKKHIVDASYFNDVTCYLHLHDDKIVEIDYIYEDEYYSFENIYGKIMEGKRATKFAVNDVKVVHQELNFFKNKIIR